jgi:oligoribonuclease
MRYYSIDIETTGLDRDEDEVLQIGVVMDDTAWWDRTPVDSLPYLRINILRDRMKGQPFALNMNADILMSIHRYNSAKTPSERSELNKEYDCVFAKPEEASLFFRDWILENEMLVDSKLVDMTSPTMKSSLTSCPLPAKNSVTIVPAGKNFGDFDKQFLKRMPKWETRVILRSRVLDPCILYWKPETDDELPGLSTCLERAGFDSIVSHDSVDDARDVVRVIRKYYGDRNLF